MAAENISFLHVSNVKSLPSPMFEIELKATFIIVESNGGVDAETFTEVGRIISHVIHEFPLEDLINDGNGAVLDMLNSMRVPVQTSTVEEIAASAVRMAAAARDGGSKVLRMRVGIETVVDYVPDFGNNDTDDDGDDDDDEQGFKLRSRSRFRSRRVCRGRGHNGRYCGHCGYR
ncbi:hypothetical protein Gotur_028339, partial [Gossypium turneri]